jgi:hydroxymethylpyrimidine pyrophosphatase-like HAD family hydrolase
MIDNRPKTIFCDIDGTLVKHVAPSIAQDPSFEMELLEGTIEKLVEWDKLGYNIILTTGRKEGLRQQTERQLQKAGIFYDQLIMGLGGGARYLINDNKLIGTPSSFSICVERNKGIKDINI